MPQWRLYITHNGDKIYRSKLKAKDVKINNLRLIKHTCVLTGKTFTDRRKFWDYVKESKLDPCNMTYDREAIENKYLMDESYLEWLWDNYFKNTWKPQSPKDNDPLECLLGSINLDLYLMLIKSKKGEIDINEYIKNKKIVEQGEGDVGEEDVGEEDVGEEDVGEEDVGEEPEDDGDGQAEEGGGKEGGEQEDDEQENNEQEDNEQEDIESNKIYNMDCLDYLKLLKNKSIDMIMLDPPYYGVVAESWDNQWKSIQDYINWFEPIIEQLNRVSKYSCSCFVFGFPYQLSYLLPIFEKYGFKYRQHITVSKGIQSVAGRTSQKLKMFPTASEYILYFYKDARDIIKNMLQEKQKEHNISSSEINEHLGKASNGGGTWSTIAGKRQKNIQYPTKQDWCKLETLFGEFNIKYDDYVYKFNLPNGLTDVWTDINFSDRKYKKLWNEKYNEKCSHPTMKPYNLIKRLVECSTVEGDIVLDIFMGTGMTGLVCRDTNRNFMGCELDSKFVDKSLIHVI